jgi:hypothetical protein
MKVVIQTKLDWDFQNAQPREKTFCFQCKHSEWLGIRYNPPWRCSNPESPNYGKQVDEDDLCYNGEKLEWLKRKNEEGFCWVCGRKTDHPTDHFCSPKHYHIYLDELRKCKNCKFHEDGRCVLGNQPNNDGDCVEFLARDINKFKQEFIDKYKRIRKSVLREQNVSQG